ncbi:MAG: hypothetical protein WAO55_01255 [Candidatus Manganitrophaceae bacterium]
MSQRTLMSSDLELLEVLSSMQSKFDLFFSKIFPETVTEETDTLKENEWLISLSNNPVFDFLKDNQEDLYSLEDGKPFDGSI